MALFNLCLFTVSFSSLLFLFFYLNHLHEHKKKKKQQQQGLTMLKEFRLLLTAVQQHRGLSMGCIDGDATFLKRIKPLEKVIKQQFAAINKDHAWLKDNFGWIGINDHWLRLLKNYPQYESEYNFRQHCNLIINLLNLIEECAEAHHLQALFCNDKKNTRFLWSQILITAEQIGQIRAIGTSIAAAKASSKLQCIQLNYLQSCINEFLANPHVLDTSLISTFLNTLNNELLTPTITISAERFFNAATLVIDDLLAQSDRYLNE